MKNLKLITWHLEGTRSNKIQAYGKHIQDAFTRLSPRDRSDIAQYGTHTSSVDVPKMNFLGDCRNETLISNLFGSVSEFARLVEENGDNFTHKGITITYDDDLSRHSFWD